MTAGLCVLRIKEMIRVVRVYCATSEPIRNLSDQYEHTTDANTANERWDETVGHKTRTGGTERPVTHPHKP